jgi:hypothetical protein
MQPIYAAHLCSKARQILRKDFGYLARGSGHDIEVSRVAGRKSPGASYFEQHDNYGSFALRLGAIFTQMVCHRQVSVNPALPNQFQSQLRLACCVLLSLPFPKVCVLQCGRGCCSRTGRGEGAELHTVENVECLPAELQADLLVYWERFGERQIFV